MNNEKTHIDFYLVGIGNHAVPIISYEIASLLKNTTVFSGGKRHYELVESFLPKHHTWIEISGKMDAVIQHYRSTDKSILVFVSGDPFFYGFGNTLKRLLPNSSIQSFPYFNSIQRLCQKTQINYNELQSVSVHGRDWSALDTVLIKDAPLIGVLTDPKKTPAIIAKRLLQYGFGNYEITVGEELDGEKENINSYQLEGCTTAKHTVLNCVLLQRTTAKKTSFGIPDTEFIPLPNRENMITKMQIRLSTIHALDLKRATTFWDIGSCTGSVAIEAKKHFPHLKITAFEKREECKVIIQQNKERFSTPGITIVIADFFNLDLGIYPKPDVVFVGGHGGRLKEMIKRIHTLNPKVRIVANAVTENTSVVFKEELIPLNYALTETEIQVNQHNKITIHTAVKNDK